MLRPACWALGRESGGFVGDSSTPLRTFVVITDILDLSKVEAGSCTRAAGWTCGVLRSSTLVWGKASAHRILSNPADPVLAPAGDERKLKQASPKPALNA